uniref:Transmembrane protein 87A n=1 Tax=Lygus hesperus TaxID=30085 RepID=A0A0A9XEF5_LYGHE
MLFQVILAVFLLTGFGSAWGFPEQAVWDLDMSQDLHKVSVTKSVFKDSKLFITLSSSNCDGKDQEQLLFIVSWSVNEALCWQNYDLNLSIPPEIETLASQDHGTVRDTSNIPCEHVMIPPEFTRIRPTSQTESSVSLGNQISTTDTPDSVIQRLKSPISGAKRSVYTIEEDGFYKVVVTVSEQKNQNFNLQLRIELRSKDGGYLSAADWPLLPFYGIMCLLYVVLGLVWLIVSFLQWRDLLRIQFWIGGVIFLGMLEMATFYAEYSSYNAKGTSDPSVVLLAEVVSCAKRTLARMLVIIVSLGFGIVKPRLGPMLHRVVGVGVLYFILAATEAYLRVFNRPKKDPTNQFVIATVPLAVLDSAICWWIFISLSQTTRTLRLRRNLVKLSLYRHFTNILIFSVVASVIFMLYSIKAHHLTDCFEDWKELWMDDAYWRLLFSIILIVIMILWRPTNNNQKYAFSPLLDAPDDDDEDEEDQFVNDAYGVKMRGQGGGSASPKPKNSINSPDDDLKWVEENIPASLADGALPILDSDEEIMATRFELSKMQ